MGELKQAVCREIAMKMNTSNIITENDANGSGDGKEEFTWKKPLELFAEKDMVKICAPMVRYSK